MKYIKLKTYGILTFICLLALMTGGCQTLEPEKSKEPTKLTLTPVELFEGEGAKFQPFLGDMTGAFKLRYKGNKPKAILDIDIWKNGKIAASAGSVGDLFQSLTDRERPEIEVIISMDIVSIKGQDEFNTIKVATISESGTSLRSLTMPWNKKLTARGLIQRSKPVSFTTDKPVYVWGIQATSTNQIHTADFSPESLSSLEWALIFTLRFED